jgi:flagellar hook assembly protein FlgD
VDLISNLSSQSTLEQTPNLNNTLSSALGIGGNGESVTLGKLRFPGIGGVAEVSNEDIRKIVR